MKGDLKVVVNLIVDDEVVINEVNELDVWLVKEVVDNIENDVRVDVVSGICTLVKLFNDVVVNILAPNRIVGFNPELIVVVRKVLFFKLVTNMLNIVVDDDLVSGKIVEVSSE